MKIKSLFASLLALTILTCTCVLPTSAKEVDGNKSVEIIILDENISAETKEKIESYFDTGEPANVNGATTYGLTCTLLSHKLESSKVATVTHKVSATSPRCLKQYYTYDACTRCDYENATLTSSEYIVCCS